MEFTAAEIAGLIKGKVIGDQGIKVHGFSPIEEGKHGHLSFIANEKFAHFLHSTESSVLIVSKNLLKEENYKPVIIGGRCISCISGFDEPLSADDRKEKRNRRAEFYS